MRSYRTPVSYTHLDVYKRQVQEQIQEMMGLIQRPQCGAAGVDGDRGIAVSYTHLDVYKRQLCGHVQSAGGLIQ